MTTPLEAVSTTELLCHGAALRALARGLLAGAADDLTQESYLAAMTADRRPRRLGAWLAGTVRRTARSWQRRDARRARASSSSRGNSPGSPASPRARWVLIWSTFTTLDDRTFGTLGRADSREPRPGRRWRRRPGYPLTPAP